jgi:hypothetical protein
MPLMGFEPMITVLERVKTVHALDRAATVTDCAYAALQKWQTPVFYRQKR